MLVVYLTRHLSGGHLNPAVTIAVTASGHLNLVKGVLYVLVQVRHLTVINWCSFVRSCGGFCDLVGAAYVLTW